MREFWTRWHDNPLIIIMMLHSQKIYQLLLDTVAMQNTVAVEEILIGLTWTLCRTEQATGLAMSPHTQTRTLPWAGSLRGRKINELAQWIHSWQMHEAVVGLAAINSVVNHDNALLAQAISLPKTAYPNLAVFEYFLPQLLGKKVAVIGRYPYLERLTTQVEWTILERQPQDTDLPDTACEFILPESDWVFVTASSLSNKTFPRLAELSRGAQLVLMGPSVPWLAELADFGVNFLAGVAVDEPALLRQTVAEGGGVRIFQQGVTYRVAHLTPDG